MDTFAILLLSFFPVFELAEAQTEPPAKNDDEEEKRLELKAKQEKKQFRRKRKRTEMTMLKVPQKKMILAGTTFGQNSWSTGLMK
mmetsp:Transcript_17626/g.43383  ORF Transcript_17626/g.43383 Transcript_17626/m.43383 type:complete len:85 (+) Transcript_17626:258-512(+)